MSGNPCSMNNTYADDEDADIVNINQKLKLHNENMQQELYMLNRKLEAQEAIQKELQEANDILEQSFVQKIAKMEQKLHNEQDRYRDMQQENKNYLSSLEVELEDKVKENKELQEKLLEQKVAPTQATVVQLNSTNDITMLEKEIKELNSLLRVSNKKVKELEETINILKDQNSELQDILHITEERLAEKNESLEQAREKLVMCRLEMESKENIPLNSDRKGNSLFAEVEDRRQADVAKLSVLHNKYTEAKRAVAGKDATIRALKAEKAALMKWKNDTGEITDKNSELIKMYKNRIVELEEKLKSQSENKEVEIQSTDSSFTYLESLLASKKKEIRELQSKIENNSVHALVQEEMKHDLIKQLRYWRYKAMSFEAQISAIKCKLETDQLDMEQCKSILQELENITTPEDL